MSMLPLVSVVIPYYNDGKYIYGTLESIQRQTYKGEIAYARGSRPALLRMAEKRGGLFLGES